MRVIFAGTPDFARAALETPFGSSWKGAAKPQVVLVEFFDYACPYCKASNPHVDQLLKENPGLRVVYRELPILGQDSVEAARLSLAASKAGRFREFHDALYAAGRPAPDTNATAARVANIPPTPVQDPAARAAWDAMNSGQRDAVNRIFANLGKAIAAYERRIMPGASRFDAFVEAAIRRDTNAMEAALTSDEVAGLRLFIGKANCIQCHSGPLFTNNAFHNTGVPAAKGLPMDVGRLEGVRKVLADEFNCLGRYSDARPEQCGELNFLAADAHTQARQFRPPSLRNVAERAPYMHAGQFATLEQALDHYNKAPAAPQGHSELKPLGLTDRETAQIVRFLGSLSAPVNAEPRWLAAP